MSVIFNLANFVILENLPLKIKEKIKKEYTVLNSEYKEAEKRGEPTDLIPRTIEYYREDKDKIIIPRGDAIKIWKMLKPDPEYIEARLRCPEVDFGFKGELRPYQKKAIIKAHQRAFSTLVVPTGGGKTVMALASIAERKQPTIIIVHTKELLYQWRDRAMQFLGLKESEIGLVGDGHYSVKPLTIALVQTARKHLEDLPKRFGYVVVDECHRTPASTFTQTVSAFPAWYSLGLSATPYRRDGLNSVIGWYCGTHKAIIFQNELTAIGAILKPQIIKRQTPFKFLYLDNYPQMITALTKDEQRNYLISQDIIKAAKEGRTCLVVSDRIAHLETLQSMTSPEAYGELLTGKTPEKKRREIVKSLQDGRLHLVFSTLSLIGEGFDCAGLDTLFIASPIKFSGRLIQTIGRILRPKEGKTPVIYDYQDLKVDILRYQAKARNRTYQRLAA